MFRYARQTVQAAQAVQTAEQPLLPESRNSTSDEVRVVIPEDTSRSSIPEDYHLLDISKEKDYMAVLQTDLTLVVYKLKITNGEIDYEEDKTTYKVDNIEGINPAYMFLSVCSGTGDVVLSFAEIDKANGLFTTKKPQPEYRHCKIFRKGKGMDDTIEFQGRAVYVNGKLVLVGEHILQVHHASTLKMEYFLDLSVLKMGHEAFIGGENIARKVTWAKLNLMKQNPVDDGIKLISITRHIHNKILVTTYRGDITRVWSILDGSLLVSFKQGESEYFMAISKNQRFIATYEKRNKFVHVYCLKSGLQLYKYRPEGVKLNEPNSYVTSVRFCTHRNYIVISGITKYADSPAKYKSFYEVWSISQERLIHSVQEKNVFNTALQPFVLERPFDIEEDQKESRSNTPSPPPQDPENNANGSENGRSGSNTPQPSNNPQQLAAAPKPEEINCALYGIFMKCNNNHLEFRSIPVYECTTSKEKGKFQVPDKIDWEGFQFRKLNNGGKIQRGFFPDVCDPLDGKKTISYVLDHPTGVYVLRFGACMTQLWELTDISTDTEKLDEAKKEKKIFDFGNLPSHPQKVYCNTVADNKLIFARAYKGNHAGIHSTFRDTWGCRSATFRFMEKAGHIIVEVRREIDGEDKAELKKDKSWIKKWGHKLGKTFHFGKDENKPVPPPPIKDELFLPFSRITTPNPEAEFCEIESAFQALHHLDLIKKKHFSPQAGYSEDDFNKNRDTFITKIEENIGKALESEKGKSYFLTISGSKTMAMLASYEAGRKLLYRIIWIDNIPINVFSYKTYGKLNENALTVLLEKTEYDFYNLMFDQMLIDYYKNGYGNLSAIMDALIYLQKEKFTPQLLRSTKKLSFLPVKQEFAPILNSEHQNMLSIKNLQEEDEERVEYLDTFAVLEQLERYDYGIWYLLPFHYLAYQYTLFLRTPSVQDILKWMSKGYHLIFGASMKKSNLAQLCVVPLPYFNSYRSLPEDTPSLEKREHKKEKNIQEYHGVFYYSYSPFSLLASSNHDNSIFKQGDTIMEMLVKYKWEEFVRSRFWVVLFCHAVFYVSYSTGVSFPEELFGYIPGTKMSHPSHYVAIILMFISGFILLVQEFRQFWLNRWEYFRSFYNYVDLAAFVLPVVTFILLLTRDPESDVLYAVSSVTTLILWAHGILRLRVFRPVGNLLEIILQLVNKIFPIIIIMILIVMGFTNAFVVLLRRQEEDFFRDAFSGNTTSGSNVTISNQSQQNLFKDVFYAYSTVWLFVFGYVDPMFSGDVGNYVMSIILLILFSFIVLLILFNVVIALMSGAIEDIRKKGNKIWIAHFAAVVSEIELLWGTNATRFNNKNNPTHVYYNANIETVKKHHSNIVKKTKKMKKEMNEHFGFKNEEKDKDKKDD